MLAVTVKDVAAGEFAGRENATEIAPLLKGLAVPTSVAVTPVGANGSRKSFCCNDLDPNSFFAILFLQFLFLFLCC